MYGQEGTAFPRAADPLIGDYLQCPAVLVSPPPLLIQPPHLPHQLPPPQYHDQLAASEVEVDSLRETLALLSSDGATSNNNGCSSACSSYSSPSSVGWSADQRPSLIQRSVSSHSLQKNGAHRVLSSLSELLDSAETSAVRRVYSTGDLQRIKMVQHSFRSESPLSSESSAIIEGMSRACRYSPEEKKERIERYRSKRNQRNFNKKIKYACRKTLADSRPRIRGRFARNEEIEKSSLADQWSHMINGGEEDEDDDENWINFLDAFSSNLIP